MRPTTQANSRSSTGPLADAGPYDYDLPVARGAGQPAPAPQPAPPPAWQSTGVSIAQCLGIFLMSFGARFLQEWSGWRLLHCYMVFYAGITLLGYWSKPRSKQGFARWVLKMVGIWLNCYVGFVTVPVSLRGTLPDALAFGLPAFCITALLYNVTPVRPYTGKKWPLWQWLLWSAGAAVFWSFLGPTVVRLMG